MEKTLSEKIHDLRAKIDTVRFRTPSPTPSMPIYTASGDGLPYYENYPYLEWDDEVTEYSVTLYLAEQVKILAYNNPSYSRDGVKVVLSSRVLQWKHNELVARFCKGNSSIIENALDWYYDDLEYIEPRVQYRKTWYSDEIESLKGAERKNAKAKARSDRNAMEYRQDIESSSNTYRYDNFDVMPTIKFLDEDLSFSNSTIVRHGKGLYIGSSANSQERVNKARVVCPEYTQKQVADLLGVSRMTVSRYWK